MIFSLWLALFLIFLFNQTLPGETLLHYEIFYGPIKLGESKIILNGREVTALAYTTGTGNLIYPYQAKWQSTLDNKGHPQKSFIYSKDPFKEREKILFFYPEKRQVQLKQRLPSPKEHFYNTTFPLFDELTAFIASWHINYAENSSYQIPIFIKGERHYAKLTYQNTISYKFNNTTKACLQIKTLLPEKSELLKRSKEIILILDKEDKIPLELRGSLPIFGSLTAKLKTYTKN